MDAIVIDDDSNTGVPSGNKIKVNLRGDLYDIRMYRIDDNELERITSGRIGFSSFLDKIGGEEDKIYYGHKCDTATLAVSIDNKEVDLFEFNDANIEDPSDNPWKRGGEIKDGDYIIYCIISKGESIYEKKLNLELYSRDNLSVLSYNVDDETGIDACIVDGISYDVNGDSMEIMAVDESVVHKLTQVAIAKIEDGIPVEFYQHYKDIFE